MKKLAIFGCDVEVYFSCNFQHNFENLIFSTKKSKSLPLFDQSLEEKALMAARISEGQKGRKHCFARKVWWLAETEVDRVRIEGC